MALVPRARSDLGRHGERVAARGAAVVVAEVVDEFFDANGVGRRGGAIGEEAAHVAVRRGVDIDGEGRNGFLAGEVN